MHQGITSKIHWSKWKDNSWHEFGTKNSDFGWDLDDSKSNLSGCENTSVPCRAGPQYLKAASNKNFFGRFAYIFMTKKFIK